MTANSKEHHDTSKGWIKLFFVCFFLVVFGIGIFAAFTYNANPPVTTQPAGH